MRTTDSRRRIAFAAGLVAAGAVLAACSGPQVESASEIVPSLTAEQRTKDQLPAPAAEIFSSESVAPASTRFVGQSDDFQYFTALKGDEEICLIPVDDQGGADMMGCTYVTGFEGLGVAFGYDDEEARLVTPARAEKAMNGADGAGWEQ